MIADTQRQMMVDCQIRTNEVSDLALLQALYSLPREEYVPKSMQDVAYSDREIEVGQGRFLLSPMVLAKLIQALELRAGEKVLDIAGGNGYGAAVMTSMGAHVLTLESAVFEAAPGVDGAERMVGPLERGAPDKAPFNTILINGSVDIVPDTLLSQLNLGGRLVTVVGRGRSGKATLFERTGDTFAQKLLFDATAPFLKEFQKVAQFAF